MMEDAYVTIRSGLLSELLEQIMYSSSSFFERLVVDLLVRMGYGGTRKEAQFHGNAGACRHRTEEKRERTAAGRKVSFGFLSATGSVVHD